LIFDNFFSNPEHRSKNQYWNLSYPRWIYSAQKCYHVEKPWKTEILHNHNRNPHYETTCGQHRTYISVHNRELYQGHRTHGHEIISITRSKDGIFLARNKTWISR
jgi:hypothetical protein